MKVFQLPQWMWTMVPKLLCVLLVCGLYWGHDGVG